MIADRLARAFARVDGDFRDATKEELSLLEGRFSEARRVPGSGRVSLFVRAAASLAEGDLAEASRLNGKLLKSGGQAEAHALKALLAAKAGRVDEAESSLAVSAGLTKRAWPFVLLANLREAGNDIGGAREALARALRREKAPWLWAELARIEERAGVIPAALKAVERAVAGEPVLAHRRLRAHLLECWREHDEAAAEYARMLELNPADAELHFSRSRTLSAGGRLQEALAAARSAEKAAPGNENLRAWRLQAQLLAGETAAASREISVLLRTKAGPNLKGRLRFLQAYALLRARRWAAAARALGSLARDCAPGDALARKASFYRTVALALAGRRASRPPERLLLLGLGVDPPYTATPAMLHAIAGADVVFNNVMGDEMFEFLRALHPDVRAVNYHQDNDEGRLAGLMLREAARGRRTAFVTRGNALVFGPLGALMLERAKAKRWAWRCEPSAASWEFIAGRLEPDPGARRGMAVLDSRSAVPGRLPDPGLPATVFFNSEAGDASVAAAGRALARQRGAAAPALVLDHVVGQRPQRWTAAQVEERRSRLSVSAIVHYPAVMRSDP